MISIRKFVGYAGAAAGISAAMLIAFSTQTGLASTRSFEAGNDRDGTQTTQVTLSAACNAAVQTLKDAVAADRSEDAAERTVAKTNPDQATDTSEDTSEDSTERANLVSLFRSVRTACAPTSAPAPTGTTAPTFTNRFTPSAACTSAVQSLKAAWASGRPATAAQWAQLKALMIGVRSACGYSTEGR